MFSFLTCFSVEHLTSMNWCKNNSMVLANVKLVLNIGWNAPRLPDSCRLKNEKVQVLPTVWSCRILVGFFQSVILKIIQHSLVRVLNFSISLSLKIWAFWMRLNTFRNTEKDSQRKRTPWCIWYSLLHRGLSRRWLCKSALVILKQFCSDSGSWLQGYRGLKNP